MTIDDLFTIDRREYPADNGKTDVHILIKFRPPVYGNALGYNGVVSVHRRWQAIGKSYRTEISWYATTTSIIVHIEMLAEALLKAAEIAKALNAEFPGETDMEYGTKYNPSLEMVTAQREQAGESHG